MKSVTFQTNRVLLLLCCAFFLIAVRVFHLGVVQRENMLKEAEKPRLRSLLIRADRGEICDRFGIPMAVNKISYHAAIYYSQISQIPARGWAIDEVGNRIRTFPRREHIKKLSALLAQELHMEAGRIEDLIHSKSTLFPHVPYVLKTNLDENEYYRLKMLEKDWPGLAAEIGSTRYYPLGKVGCHIIGTLGSISQKQISNFAQEIHQLQTLVTNYETFGEHPLEIEEIYKRLETLKDKAYTLNDKVGKTGIEGEFEEELRGRLGIRNLYVDNDGKPKRELPSSKPPQAGGKISLTISAELQQFAEELLIANEKERDHKSIGIDPIDKKKKEQKQPWIKGGAIVAMDPRSGEILALASYPRFDPNDFIGNTGRQATRWLENERIVGAIWDGRENLARERKNGEEQIQVTWNFFLSEVLPTEGPLRTFFEKVDDIRTFVQVQEDFQTLLYFSGISDAIAVAECIANSKAPLWEYFKNHEDASTPLKRLDTLFQSIASPQDRLFAIDLCGLCVNNTCFSDDLLSFVGSMKISHYRDLNQAFCRLYDQKKEETWLTFHQNDFSLWRKEHEKKFLYEKRALEKAKKTFAKPYLDYLDKHEKELFAKFWDEHDIEILTRSISESDILQKTIASLPLSLTEEFLRSFRFFEKLDRIPYSKKFKSEKDLARAFYPIDHFGFCRSYAFQSCSPQGSIFKLVTSYEGLRQGQSLTIIDQLGYDPNASAGKKQIVAYTPNMTPYPRLYKGGRLPKSASWQIGKVDIAGAIERSSNPFFSILAGDYLKNPEDLNIAASNFGYGEKTGIELPGEVRGSLPSDLKINTTGLYSYAIGQHTLLNTPLQSSLMLSTLANGGNLLRPKIVHHIDEEQAANEPIIKHSVWLPNSIRNTIFEGMDRCVWGNKGQARSSVIRSLLSNPLLMHEYHQLQHQMIGKTSTTQVAFNPSRYPSSTPQIYNHLWFGAIAFQGDATMPSKILWESPELVVVVMLRFGGGGKDAAPLAAQMIQKWREIRSKYEKG
jgi:cell division protein FtsI/penicillin-binding protein 2